MKNLRIAIADSSRSGKISFFNLFVKKKKEKSDKANHCTSHMRKTSESRKTKNFKLINTLGIEDLRMLNEHFFEKLMEVFLSLICEIEKN
jgi:hypothetical protein